MELLQKLCSIAAPSGNEAPMKKFILEYLNENISNFKYVIKTEWVNNKIIEGVSH